MFFTFQFFIIHLSPYLFFFIFCFTFLFYLRTGPIAVEQGREREGGTVDQSNRNFNDIDDRSVIYINDKSDQYKNNNSNNGSNGNNNNNNNKSNSNNNSNNGNNNNNSNNNNGSSSSRNNNDNNNNSNGKDKDSIEIYGNKTEAVITTSRSSFQKASVIAKNNNNSSVGVPQATSGVRTYFSSVQKTETKKDVKINLTEDDEWMEITNKNKNGNENGIENGNKDKKKSSTTEILNENSRKKIRSCD